MVLVQERRADWILLSFTYRYDVLQGNKQLRNIPQSDIMTVEDYKERFPNLAGAENGRARQMDQ
jgi:hypothetical protein